MMESTFQPLHHAGMPSDIGEAVVYLSGAAFATGTDLILDGGLVLGQKGGAVGAEFPKKEED